MEKDDEHVPLLVQKTDDFAWENVEIELGLSGLGARLVQLCNVTLPAATSLSFFPYSQLRM